MIENHDTRPDPRPTDADAAARIDGRDPVADTVAQTRTPAEELRDAATKLRKTAANATPGPWRIRSGNDVSANVSGSNADLIIDGGGYASNGKVTVYGAALNTDAAWIALAHPGLAGPLAEWLEAVSSGWQQSIALFPDGAHARFNDHPALAVARVINGTES